MNKNKCTEYQIVNKKAGIKGDKYQDKEVAEQELQKIKTRMKGQCGSEYTIQKIKC